MLLLLTVYFTFALQEVTDTSLEKAQKKNERKLHFTSLLSFSLFCVILPAYVNSQAICAEQSEKACCTYVK